jgi:hypothetical protein
MSFHHQKVASYTIPLMHAIINNLLIAIKPESFGAPTQLDR